MAKFKKEKPNKFNKQKTDTFHKTKSTADIEGYFKVSFKYLDTRQEYASGWKDWQKAGLLSKAMETIQGYCASGTLNSQICGSKFTKYGNFPPTDKTKFEHPLHVPEDACWARIHITGPAVLAGHIFKDTFYVVFLDKSHKFYLTKKVTGK